MTQHIRPISIWLFHDQKPGHIHQLEGLRKRLAAHAEIQVKWIDTQSKRFYGYCLDAEFLRPKPDIIIGAGHGTHASLMWYKRKYQAFTAVLMTPSLPRSWFDAIICPEHDGLKQGGSILNTRGMINTIEPGTNTNRDQYLILIGGPSKHYYWQEPELVAQVQSLCQRTPERHWQLFDSLRTPPSFVTRVEKLALPNLQLNAYTDTPLARVEEALAQAEECWVSPDSASMLYEALTAGARVGVFDLQSARANRVVRGVESLVDTRQVLRFVDWQPELTLPRPTKPIWEADRAAIWLLHQYAKWQDGRHS
jgi:mitochondrial fission protein ELM1